MQGYTEGHQSVVPLGSPEEQSRAGIPEFPTLRGQGAGEVTY